MFVKMNSNNTIWNILQKEIFYWIDKLFLVALGVALFSFLIWLELEYEVINLLWSVLFSLD